MHALTLLGRDHVRYGRPHVQHLNHQVSAAICVGGQVAGRSMAAKGDPNQPNEDALMALDDGRHVLLAVADAHFGVEASHVLVEALAGARPTDMDGVIGCLRRALFIEGETRSETTLTIALFDRETGAGEGLTFGDSSAVIIDAAGARRLFGGNHRYVRPGDVHAMRFATRFEFALAPDALLVLFTDGVDECNYRSPATSIGLPHLADLYASTRGVPGQFARRLANKALNGVDGHPGGEDNLAIIAARR